MKLSENTYGAKVQSDNERRLADVYCDCHDDWWKVGYFQDMVCHGVSCFTTYSEALNSAKAWCDDANVSIHVTC